VCLQLRCLVVVAGVLVEDGDVLEVHVINDKAIDVQDGAVKWEAHGTLVEDSVAVA
jgi:hypothetical protein